MAKTWGKEDELKQLKSELATLDRKIAAELATIPENSDGVENRNVKTDTIVEISKDPKKTMVAEPLMDYKHATADQPFPKTHSVRL